MTNKEIEAFNKTFGIETVFYYDDKSICGYEENNTIYLNLNSKKDLKNVNMHELLHFFEETEMFSKIKERVIKRLKENNVFDELKEEYELKYFGIYSLDEIEKGIIDNEIVIDVLVGDFPYFKKEELEDLCKEILKAEKKETDSRRYLILNMNNNIRNMNISKWEKIFASNYYKNKNYDGNTPAFPSNNKEQVIKEDIEKELNKLYNLDKDTFKISLDSQSLIREYESELKALEQGDFYVFIDNDNKPHIAVKMNGNEIDEVRGIKNGDNQELEEEYRDVAISFLENNKDIKNGKNWLDKEEWNKRLIRYSKEIEDGTFNSEETPKLIEDLLHSDYRSHFGTNSNLEELKKLSKIKKYLAEYYNCTEEKICVGDYIPKEETRCPYKVILGNADFRYSNVTNLGDLQKIEGNAIFSFSKITNLGKLQSIGGFVDFEDSNITNLEKLQIIGKGAYFSDSEITNLGELQSIGGNARFCDSKITTLGELQNIGGDAYFNTSNIIYLGKLQSIGRTAYFPFSKVTDLGNIEYIGGEIMTDENNSYLKEEYERRVNGKSLK